MFDRAKQTNQQKTTAEQDNASRGSYPRMTMTVNEMSEELNVSRPTAYELVKQDGFPAFRLGQRILVNRAGLQRWLDKQCEASL